MRKYGQLKVEEVGHVFSFLARCCRSVHLHGDMNTNMVCCRWKQIVVAQVNIPSTTSVYYSHLTTTLAGSLLLC